MATAVTSAAALVLRDIHQPPAPPWWPPAPGWWLLAGLVLLTVVAVLWIAARRRRLRRRIAELFDRSVEIAASPAEQVAAISELLRRAARRRDPDADRLRGEDWLVFLDSGSERTPFTRGPGRLLLDGGYRADTDARQVAALQQIARARFLDWMGAR